MNGVKRLTIVFIAAMVALVAFISSASAAAPAPNYGSGITVDGSYSDWDLSADYFADMYRAGDPIKVVESKLYLRYNCNENVMYALVLAEDRAQALEQAGNAWIAIDATSNKVVTGGSGDDGVPPDFQWVYDTSGTLIGYEASFAIDEGTYKILAHIEVFDDGAEQTSATHREKGEPALDLEITCPPAPTEYDLYLEKSGPEYIFVNDPSITYNIMVGNNGPASVSRSDITITDETFSQTIQFDEEGGFVKGDVNTNGLLDPGEMWQATLTVPTTSVPNFGPDTYITNTACVEGPEGGDTDPANNCDDASVYVWWYGYTPGYWKNHPAEWPSPYTTTTTIGSVFTSAPDNLKSNTFMTALGYKGGTGTEGAARILLRAAVAAVMNEKTLGDGYPPYATTDELISAVNAALASNDRATMITLANTLDKWNNGYHP